MLKDAIPKLYRNGFFEIALWAWVTGQKCAGASSEKGAIRDFTKYFNLEEDDCAVDSLKISYFRKKKEFQQMMERDRDGIYFAQHEDLSDILELFELREKINRTPMIKDLINQLDFAKTQKTER